LGSNPIDEESVVAAALDPTLPNLTEISFGNRHRVRRKFVTGLNGQTRLDTLEIALGTLGRFGMCALTRSPLVAHLRVLRLPGKSLNEDEIRILTNSPYLTRLIELDLSDNALGAEAAIVLATKIPWRRLERLSLSGNAIGPRGTAILARSPLMAHLTHLDFSQNLIQDLGADALARSGYLTKLRELDVALNGLTPTAHALLEVRFGYRVNY
jgi:Leucine-rich repeat (LRR) protein